MKEDILKLFNYQMGIQIATLIRALGMHWENETHRDSVPFIQKDFDALIEENSNALTHNGILRDWGKVL